MSAAASCSRSVSGSAARHEPRQTPGPGQRVSRSLAGCPASEARERLRRAGLRPTAQRCTIAWLLSSPTPRHITPEGLYGEAVKARLPVSLASVYNILRQFTEAGLLRQRIFTGGLTVFDTDVSDHQHCVVEETGEVMNLSGTTIPISGVLKPPEGFEITGVELIVRLRSRTRTRTG